MPSAPGFREACEEIIQCWEEDQEVIEFKKLTFIIESRAWTPSLDKAKNGRGIPRPKKPQATGPDSEETREEEEEGDDDDVHG